MPPNAFTATLAASLASNGTESEIYVSTITTLTGETMTTSQFATMGRGVITIDPLSSTSIEFASFTTVDASGIGFTGITRGLSSLSNTAIAANKKYHPVGTQVIISFGVHNLLDLQTYIVNTAFGTVGSATTTTAGSTKLSVAPVSALSPISVGDNDPRVTQYVVDTGSANTYAIAPSPAITAYAAGQIFRFKATSANTTTSTLNVNSLGAKTILKLSATNLAANDILAGAIVEVQYDGTNFQMLSQIGNTASATIPLVTKFTASGTWSKSAGMVYAIVEVVGAGGNGGAASSGTTVARGGGGGGGGYSRKRIAAATLGATETVTVGTTAGATSSFGAHASATGGAVGTAATVAGQNRAGGTAGIGSSGDINSAGGGGSSGGGSGGSSFFGGGGGGSDTTGNGGNAQVYGGGGGGASADSGSGATSGGTFASGVVIVTEYYI